MFKHVIHGVSITSVLDRRRANTNGDYPVRIVVNFQREKKYYTTGKVCSEEVWQRMPATKTKELIDLRKEIQIVFDLIKNHVLRLLADDDFSLRNLDMSLRRSAGKTLGELIEEKIVYLKKAGRIGTMESYRSTMSNIRKFKGDTTPIDRVDIEWLKKLDEFLARTKAVSTIGINMRNIRTIVNGAINDGYMKQSDYPFGVGKYEIKTAEGIKKALSSEQISKIKKIHSRSETLMKYRDLWLFIYYCNGINIADLVNRKFKDIVDGELLFVREKTKRTTKNTKYIRATVTDDMQKLIDRWGNANEPENYIFDLVEHTADPELAMARKGWFNKKFNQHLKMIGTAVGIDNLTSYTARHSILSLSLKAS